MTEKFSSDWSSRIDLPLGVVASRLRRIEGNLRPDTRAQISCRSRRWTAHGAISVRLETSHGTRSIGAYSGLEAESKPPRSSDAVFSHVPIASPLRPG